MAAYEKAKHHARKLESWIRGGFVEPEPVVKPFLSTHRQLAGLKGIAVSHAALLSTTTATMGGVDTVATSSPARVDKPWQRFTRKQRFLLWLITWAGYFAIRLLGPTIRFSVSWEEGSPKSLAERPFVYSFWHNCMIPAMYWCRNLQVRVMSSDSFDGEYTGRIMQKFGFVKIRGSSSKGAVRALLGMRKELEQGWTVAFTIDGPRGPRYLAKPGPVVLSRTTGAPMVVFHIALDRVWTLDTWDRCMIPKPFCRALIRVSRAIAVPPGGEQEHYLEELQAALDRVRRFAEENIDQVGTREFPYAHSNREEHA